MLSNSILFAKEMNLLHKKYDILKETFPKKY